MSQWYVKELSQLTGISVQTLHHYDRIGLLEPSVRLDNAYRLYSEKDLLKLQQIIALKFFGFDLSRIKNLLKTDVDMIDHFSIQSKFLEEKAKTLFEASQTLKNIISSCRHNKSIPWKNIIKLIEVYRMTQQLEKTWAGEILTADELKEYARFEHEFKNRFSEKEQKALQQGWEDIVNLVNANLDKNPGSEFGINLGNRCMAWVNAYYGKNHAALRNAIWEKGLKTGKIDEGVSLSQESFEWLDKAISAYFCERVKTVFDQIETKSPNTILKQW
ncbi:MAG TPA: MerR family transcriptional regulator, partial [Gammaproteobacteria bacterium]|nr:MerR family transcriptional regulator [Gammaproteobacteria bacterium]